MRHPHYKPLFDALYATQATRILEIGTHEGEHAEAMLRIAGQWTLLGRQPIYVGFDLFGPAEPDELPKATFPDLATVQARLMPLAEVTLIPGNTRDTLPAFVHARMVPTGTKFGDVVPDYNRFDLIFVDGGHSLQTATSDLTYALYLLSRTGLIIVDDYYPDNDAAGPKRLVDHLKTVAGLGVVVYEPASEFPQSDGSLLRVNMAAIWRTE